MKIIVTGASGMLGSDIIKATCSRDIPIIKLCHKKRPGYLAVDLTTADGIQTVADQDWDMMIHTAALRDPDWCGRDQNKASLLNTEATKQLVQLACERDAGFVYISTDYVFSGKTPPYTEDATPSPINFYGKTKLAGEEEVLKGHPDFCVLRIPLLYGIAAGPDNSPLINTALKALYSNEPWPMEDSIVRYPTYTGDVAEAIHFLIERSASGIYHFSGRNNYTKYGITEVIAHHLGESMDSVLRLEIPPPSEEPRPQNSHLSMEKILELGFPEPEPFEKRIGKLLNTIKDEWPGFSRK